MKERKILQFVGFFNVLFLSGHIPEMSAPAAFDNKEKDNETAAKTAALETKSIAVGDIAMTEKILAASKAALESAKQNFMAENERVS